MMPAPGLLAALRACARGLYSAEASFELLIRRESLLARSDFRVVAAALTLVGSRQGAWCDTCRVTTWR